MYALTLKGKTSPDLLTSFLIIVYTQGSRRDKPIIEFDPEIEKTLKKNRSRVKAQRTLQFDQEELNSEEGASEKSFEEELVEENIEEEIQDNTTTLQLCTDGYYQRPRSTEFIDG
ncbi:hypothetical protein PIB30_092433 [Stylosanthes scabra]|uniref:Uncharacterized protein n=1 Tax=Stylosanthes scabra TaxID=79078 RepID=A0ABU6RVU1_9FABA|nr:hypothetical protein [Stylosanthes scabra]